MFRKAYRKTIGQIFSSTERKKRRNTFNPKRILSSVADTPVTYSLFRYNSKDLESRVSTHWQKGDKPLPETDHITWINVDGVSKEAVEQICSDFGVHPLLAEDILSLGQRAKADDMDTHLFALMPMLYYNNNTGIVQIEQLCIVLGQGFLLSFQADPQRNSPDPLHSLKDRLKNELAPVRKKSGDYLAYCIMDAVVDDYFTILEKLSDRLEQLEDEVVTHPNDSILLKVTLLRHELMVVKRAITPVRELINAFWHSENPLIEKANRKYFKDVYDHIVLAIEYTDNYREMAINVQDLYMNKVNTRMNEVMKILTVVTTLLAPATVIGGIFGMNFDRIPFSHVPNGFMYTVLFMLLCSVSMIWIFKRKDWF